MANNIGDGIIDRWANEALDDLGKKSWREIEPNSMMLIIYKIQETKNRKLVSKISRPFWWLVGAVGTGVVWAVISNLTGVRMWS